MSSTDLPILGQVALGYSPMIDRKRNVVATRLTLFPLRADSELDASQLLAAVGEVWPAGGPQASLNVLSESLLQQLLAAAPSTNLMIEVPSFMAVAPQHGAALRALHARGVPLLLKGRPLSELPREVLPCFRWSIVDVDEERRVAGSAAPPGVTRTIGHVQSGVRTLAQMEASFERGAAAVLGWPIEDIVAKPGRKAQQPDMQVVVELIHRVDAEEPIDRLEATLRRDPTLAFKLLRYINSPAFGLRVEINSFAHAIMMLGYKKLKRWLALLLATAGQDPNLRPVDAVRAQPQRAFLFFHGLADDFVPPGNADELRAASPNPDSALVLVPGAKHVRTYEADPAAYMARVYQFFDKEMGQ